LLFDFFKHLRTVIMYIIGSVIFWEPQLWILKTSLITTRGLFLFRYECFSLIITYFLAHNLLLCNNR
jgi:hypothetical protein